MAALHTELWTLSGVEAPRFQGRVLANPQRRLVPTHNMLNLAGAPDLAYIERWTQTLNLSDQGQESQHRVAEL